MFWSEGHVLIAGGSFLENKASDDGGAFFASDNSTTALEGGLFEGNEASKGGVGCVNDGADLKVTGGNITGNIAHNEGGAFSVDEGGTVEVGEGILLICRFCFEFACGYWFGWCFTLLLLIITPIARPIDALRLCSCA